MRVGLLVSIYFLFAPTLTAQEADFFTPGETVRLAFPSARDGRYLSDPKDRLAPDAEARLNERLGRIREDFEFAIFVFVVPGPGGETVRNIARETRDRGGPEVPGGMQLFVAESMFGYSEAEYVYLIDEGVDWEPRALEQAARNAREYHRRSGGDYAGGIGEFLDSVQLEFSDPGAREASPLDASFPREDDKKTGFSNPFAFIAPLEPGVWSSGAIFWSWVLSCALIICGPLIMTLLINRMPANEAPRWMYALWPLYLLLLLVAMISANPLVLLLGYPFVALQVGMLGRRRIRKILHGPGTRDEKYRELQRQERITIELGLLILLFPVPMLFILPWIARVRGTLRTTPPPCPSDGKPMRKLAENEENRYLSEPQILEELARSVDYDVWRCDEHAQVVVFAYDNPSTSYEPCPQCNHTTYRVIRDVVLVPATEDKSGRGEQTFFCRFCDHEAISQYVIPPRK